jgi:sucrose-6-phosphate hydrolase SacC (GH32 family)
VPTAPTTTRPRPPEPGPFWADAEVVLAPDDPRPGAWAGGPSAQLDAGTWWLAYRLRRPVGAGRGYVNVVARSDDGVRFTPVVELAKERFGAESLERPALVHTPDGRWRLYVSCATPGTKHWRVDLLEADSPAGLADAAARTVLPGSDGAAVKDPVLRHDGAQWHLWASVHPLEDPDATDRMTTEHATSPDGVEWTWRGTALAGTEGSWDARGVRFATVVLDGSRTWALYDGRATAEENFEERTGLAVADEGSFTAVGDAPLLQSPHPPHGLRYADVVALPDGGARWFYEATRRAGAHELRTVLLPG